MNLLCATSEPESLGFYATFSPENTFCSRHRYFSRSLYVHALVLTHSSTDHRQFGIGDAKTVAMRDDSEARCARPTLRSILVLMALSGVYPLAGQNASPKHGSDEPVLQERYPRYRLRAGDVMEMTFPFTPEFNQTV